MPEQAGKVVEWQIAPKRGSIKKPSGGETKALIRWVEQLKASVRAKVEVPFHVVKNHRGIAKNKHQWLILSAMANVYMTRKVVTE